MSHYRRLRKCKKLRERKKTCVKKSKVESQISTRASYKKNNEKYYHDYDDDAKRTMIDYVNDDCLVEIFMYLPACERPKIALVCEKWKKALDYSWSNVNKLELTHWEYNECPSYLKEYPTVDGQFNFLSFLLGKCGSYLTELDLTAHDNCNIVPVINESCPNLVKLQLRFKYNIEHELLVDAFSRLSKLKVLKIIFQHINNTQYIPVNLLNSLKSIAGTLTELSLSNWDKEKLCRSLRIPKTFTRVIPKLKALKSFEINDVQIDKNIYRQLKQFGVLVLSYAYFYFDNIECCTELYKNIKDLNLVKYLVTNDCIYTIVNCMGQLEKLELSTQLVTDAGVVAISKIINLKNLLLQGHSDVTDSSIKLLKNLETLNLPFSNKITDVSVTKILENSPKMRIFFVVESAVTLDFIKKAAEIAEKRKKVLQLGFPETPGIKQYESRYLELCLTRNYKSSIKTVYMSKSVINN